MDKYPANLFLSCRTLVYQIDDVHVRDARVGLKAYLTRPAVGIAHFDVVSLNLRAQLAQSVLVEFRECKATVAGEAATANALWQTDFGRTHLGKVDEVVGNTHQAR